MTRGRPAASNQTLTTPPFGLNATTLPAANITADRATLDGSVNPTGLATLAWFEWGTTANYGNFTAQSSLGSGSLSLAVSNALTGLGGMHNLPLSNGRF